MSPSPSEPTLSQEEIEQLVTAVRTGKIPTARSSLASLAHARPIDFLDPKWSQARIVRRRLAVLDLVFSRLLPSVQLTLSKNLRFPVRVIAEPPELQQFGDFIEQFRGRSTLVEVFRMEPLRGFSVIVMDTLLIYALVDALMGGLGVPEMPEDREISDIELSLAQRVHTDLLRDFESAWRPFFPLGVDHVRMERTNKFTTTLPAEEVCHITRIEAAGDVVAPTSIYFVLPYSTLEPLHSAITAESGEEVDPSWRTNLEQHVGLAETRVSVVVGETHLSTERVMGLSPGDLIELPGRADQDVEIRVGGEPVFEGRIGRSHQRYAVKVTARRKAVHRITDRTAGQTLVRKGLISREQLAVAEVDEILNRRSFLDSIVARGWVDRRVLEQALSS